MNESKPRLRGAGDSEGTGQLVKDANQVLPQNGQAYVPVSNAETCLTLMPVKATC